MIEALTHFFKPVPIPDSEDNGGDDSKTFETWTMIDPSRHKLWILLWVPYTLYLTFASSFKGNVDQSQVIDFDTRITKFDSVNADVIKLLCLSTRDDPYNFAITIDTTIVPFNAIHLVQSLEPSCFDEIQKMMKEEVLGKKCMTKQGHALKAKSLSFKLRNVLTSISVQAKLRKARTAPS